MNAGLLLLAPLVAASRFDLVNRQASVTVSGADVATRCAFPTTITIPAGLPSLGAAAQSFAVTATDPCAILGTNVPSAVAADVSSYTSAVSQWASNNAAAITSYDNAVSSFLSTITSDSVCSSLYAGYSAELESVNDQCASVTGIVSSVVSSVISSGVAASTTASAVVSGSTSAQASGSASARAVSSSGLANGLRVGATGGVNVAVLVAGASVAFTSLLGMLLL